MDILRNHSLVRFVTPLRPSRCVIWPPSSLLFWPPCASPCTPRNTSHPLVSTLVVDHNRTYGTRDHNLRRGACCRHPFRRGLYTPAPSKPVTDVSTESAANSELHTSAHVHLAGRHASWVGRRTWQASSSSISSCGRLSFDIPGCPTTQSVIRRFKICSMRLARAEICESAALYSRQFAKTSCTSARN